jgi:hypothetical protein
VLAQSGSPWQITLVFAKSFLHYVHAVNLYKADHICLSVRLSQHENRSTDLDEMCCGRHATEICPRNRTFQFPAFGNTVMADEETCEVGSTLVPLAVGQYNDAWFWIFGKYKTLV